MAAKFNAPDHLGALVRDVTPDSPGEAAGLQRGDVIREVNGDRVRDTRELRLKISGTAPGESVKLAVLRDGSEKALTAKLGELPGEEQTARSTTSGTSVLAGLQVSELTADVARELKLEPGTRGVVVTNVAPSSAAQEAGLQRADVIMEINRKPVTSVAEFRSGVSAAGKESILMLVNRGGNVMFLVVESH
jgi:serine protease Do